MTRKEYKLDRFVNSSNSIIFNLVRNGEHVLDVGCADGYLAERFTKEKHCEVVGIELDPDMAIRAKKHCKKVFSGDVEELDIPYPENYFDAIIFGDILEHTKDPKKTIIKYKKFLATNGRIIISLPNIAFWSVRLKLLFGNFNYQDCGILDKTHLKFYTIKTAKELCKECGLRIFETRYAGRLIHYLKIFPALFACQSINVGGKYED